MRIVKIFAAALVCAALSARAAGASQLDAQLDKIARQFAQDAAAKLPDLNPVTAAVFPFQAEDALAKRKVDVAVGELLTQKLIRESRFRLLERNQLDTVLREQKLGLSGAIESDTAARVGKLAGARLAALGSVTRMGKNYQISAKLVDTETGEVASVSIVEVPREVFDEEAARYLVLVPETQTVSIYIPLGVAPMQVKNLAAFSAAGANVVPANIKVGANVDNGLYAGIGLKYFPFSRWAVDLAFLPQYKIGNSRKSVVTNFSGAGASPGMMPAQAEGMILRALVNRQFRLTRAFNFYAGGGFMRFELDPRSDDKSYNTSVGLAGGGSMRMAPDFGAGRYSTALGSLGLEWRPQSRFGLSFQTTFPLSSAKYKWEADVTNAGTKRVTVWELSYPKYLAEASLAWYF